jgi:hypothetical protein
MRHRASRPLIDMWHRLPRAGARLIGKVARPGPARALVAVMLVASLGTGAYVTVGAVMEGSSDQQAGSMGIDPLDPTTSDDGEGSSPSSDLPTSDGRTPNGSSPEPGASAGERSETPSPATSVSPSERSNRGQGTGSSSTGTATPSTTPSGTPPSSSSPPSETPSKNPDDRTPPNTSLSEDYPEGDAARFSFSSNESASFACSLDGAAYTSCDSPTSYSDLRSGWHTFAVRATDAAGNVDPSPAEVRWHATEGGSVDQ